MKTGSIHERFPLFAAFGEPRQLTPAESAVASFDERFESIFQYLIKRVLDYQETLKPRERANFEPEDLLLEIWIKLKTKDDKWEPDRARYITFAGKVVDNELSSIRDKSRTVESPRNSVCRMKEYQAEADAGTISPRRSKTFDDIRRSIGEMSPVEDRRDSPSGDGEAEEAAARSEEGEIARSAVISALRPLTVFEARVVGEVFGLWGQPRRTIEAVAGRTQSTINEVRRAKASGQTKMGDRLLAMGHPVAASDN